MSFVEQLPDKLRQKSHGSKRRIVLPESHDSRIIDAAQQMKNLGLADVLNIVLVTPPSKSTNEFQAELENQYPNLLDCDFVSFVTWADYDETSQNRLIDTLLNIKKYSDLDVKSLTKLLQEPLILATTLLKLGDVDGCVSGADSPTSDVIRAGLRIVGLAESERLISSYFVMDFTDNTDNEHTILFADAAINVDPDSEDLVIIAEQTARSVQQILGVSPSVAMLSFSTYGSAKHLAVDKVAKASHSLRERNDFPVLGEIQFDAALMPAIRSKKVPNEEFHDTPCNVMVFPSLEAGNIGYKIAERVGGATAIGPIIQGLAKPLNDLSRGTSVESVVLTVLLTALQS